MSNKFIDLISCENKQKLATLCKSIQISSEDFTNYIIACKSGHTHLNHMMHYFDYVPPHLETRKEDWNITQADEATRNSKEGKKHLRRLFKSHGQRKYKVGHMFMSKEHSHPISQWHFIFFEINELNKTENHWILGSHIHMVNYHWPNIYCQEVWNDFINNKKFPSAKLHIQYSR